MTSEVAAQHTTVATAASPTPVCAAVSMDVIKSSSLRSDELAAIARFAAQRPNVGIFLTPAWLKTFEVVPPGRWEPWIARFREGSVLRGIAPLGLTTAARSRRVTLLGGGAASDRTDILAERGYESQCADALLAWMRDSFGPKGFVLELRDVPHDSPIWGAMRRLDPNHQVVLSPREVHAGPFLDLHEFASPPVATLPSVVQLTDSLERHRRKLERRGHLRIELLRDAGEAATTFDTLVKFLHARWEHYPCGSAMDDPWKQRFQRHLIPLLLQEGTLRMVRISVDLRTMAVLYAVSTGQWWGCYLIGYDRPAAGQIHLGRMALSVGIALAIQEGAAEFDFLKGAEPVKYLWPVRERVTVDADVFAHCPGAQLTRAVRAARDVGIGVAKSVRHLLIPR